MPIRILDAAVVGRIAAGEVVERPSSVVKELVENSLDAGATSITVEIKGGGIEYLRVTDNGCGIEPNQVRLAFENHATSKIQTAEQLDDIRTFGFRGEALPSIASVSRIEMTTRAKGQETGVRLNMDGGQDIRVREIGAPEGTTIIVKDLFYNIPVRRAFLKKANYEGGLLSDVVAKLMIGNPGVSMRFINNGNTVYHTYGDGKLRNAIFAVYGKAAASQMTEVDAMEGGTRIFGLIGTGELAKSTRAHQMFFINGRAVRCPLLTRALETICKSRVTIGMYPMCALNLTLPPNSIDVNVHPNKLEVRFRDEETTQLVVEKLLGTAYEGEKVLDFRRDAVQQSAPERTRIVREIPMQQGVANVAPAEPEKKPSMPELLRTEERKESEFAAAEKVLKSVKPEITNTPSAVKPPMPPLPKPIREESFMDAIEQEKARLGAEQKRSLHEPEMVNHYLDPVEKVPAKQTVMPVIEERETVPNYRVIGVVFKTYILIEVNDTLLLIDQHAAHERLRYEMYTKQLEEGTASQQLLTPLFIRVSAREMALIRDNLEVLEEAGYTVEPFGELDIQVRAVPFVLGKAEIRPLFLDMLTTLSRLKAATQDARRAEIMQMSCKSAVKGGDMLTSSEIEALVKQMLETGAPPTCPHGRPVVKAISKVELEKMFKRIQ